MTTEKKEDKIIISPKVRRKFKRYERANREVPKTNSDKALPNK
jgi:hypothetical protein